MARDFSSSPRSSGCAVPTRRGERVTVCIRPWRAGDEDAFDPREDFAEEAAANRWPWSKGPPGPTWTLVECATASLHERGLEGARVLGIGGAVKGEGDSWMAWATLAPLSRRQWVLAVDLAGIVVDHVLSRPDVRWLWAQCRAENLAAARVLNKLGFALHHLERADLLGGIDIKCMIREG